MFLGGSPAFLQQIQVHECRFKFLPICLSSMLLCSSQLTCSTSLFLLKEKNQTKNQVSRNAPFSKHNFPGFRYSSEIPPERILFAVWGKVKSNVVINDMYFLPVKEEWIFEVILYCWSAEEALANLYPGVPWIHNASIAGVVVWVSRYWIWLRQSDFIEIACWYLKQY